MKAHKRGQQDLLDYHNIVEAIGKIEPMEGNAGFHPYDDGIGVGHDRLLDRINTIIKDNGDKR